MALLWRRKWISVCPVSQPLSIDFFPSEERICTVSWEIFISCRNAPTHIHRFFGSSATIPISSHTNMWPQRSAWEVHNFVWCHSKSFKLITILTSSRSPKSLVHSSSHLCPNAEHKLGLLYNFPPFCPFPQSLVLQTSHSIISAQYHLLFLWMWKLLPTVKSEDILFTFMVFRKQQIRCKK